MFKLGDCVQWDDSPQPMTERSQIRGISPDSKYALLDWVSIAIAVDRLKPVKSSGSIRNITVNEWIDCLR